VDSSDSGWGQLAGYQQGNEIILICFQLDAILHSLFIYFWKTALRVSGGISTHHQKHKQLYLQYLVLVKPLLLPVAIVEELELV